MRRIIVFGAAGRLGRVFGEEAQARGHAVTAAVRERGDRPDLTGRPGIQVVAADATDAAVVAAVAGGHDVAISVVGPVEESSPELLTDVALALLDGVARAGVPRLVIVGGAGSLEVAPGRRLVDEPGFPEVALPTARAHAAALDAVRSARTEVDWLVVSPPAIFEPDGPRTGRYEVGGDAFVTDDEGVSRGSYADFALAVLDEVETPAHHRRRISIIL